MLECYLDDSGTHQGSSVVVWGGVLGHPTYIQQLSEDWAALLRCPCDGKPPIRRFHSFDLMAGRGEFEGYNQAERDLTRRNFRKAITDNDLSVLAFGVSAESWEAIVQEQEQMHWFTAEQMVIGSAIKETLAASANEHVLIRFD